LQVCAWQVCENITASAGSRINYSNRLQQLDADGHHSGTGFGRSSAPLVNWRFMLGTTERRRNIAPWWGLLLAIGSVACNVAFFVSPPLQGALPWLSMLFAAFALVFLATGLKRAFSQPRVYRGKALSVILTVVALFPVALTTFAFVTARKLPSSTAAPQVGQRVPDFKLADTSGTAVTLDQLLAPDSSQARAPKAVLLIFYRGYW
jgi:hypothetical protein